MRLVLVTFLSCLALSSPASMAAVVTCADGHDGSVAEALARIRAVVDPCGESSELLSLVDELERCPAARYQICARIDASRNLFERPQRGVEARPGVITWNPELRSELEPECESDPARAVRRDPLASLVHEIAHAVQDCRGLPAGRLELEAVRVENIYRRAAGLCQRRGYGDEPLPAAMRRVCTQAASSSP
jgi:hypothetical protein